MQRTLIATDLDGTIVRSDGRVSGRTVAALGRVADAGGQVVLVTGRPPRWMHEIAATIGHFGLALCANGAMVYDLHDERVISADCIDVPTLAGLVGTVSALLPEVGFGVEYPEGMVAELGYGLRGWDDPASLLRQVERAELLTRPCAKLLCRHPTLTADELLALIGPAVGDVATPTHSNGNGLVEISARGVSKAAALAALCADRGIHARDVVAFGDMPNDLPMLAWAGTAYAVANAHPDVLAAVELRTGANDDDGVAAVIERLFPATT